MIKRRRERAKPNFTDNYCFDIWLLDYDEKRLWLKWIIPKLVPLIQALTGYRVGILIKLF